jgi:hypothetical protein
MKTLLTKLLVVSLILVVPLSLTACDSGSETEDVGSEQSADGSESGQDVGDDTAGSDTSDDAASDTNDGAATDADVVLPAGFPSSMPIPDGTLEVSVSPAFDEGYDAYVPARNYLDVIAELEAALPAAGWEIMERTSGYAVKDDVLFLVTSDGLDMYVFVEPRGSDEDETLVTYYVPE